MSSENNKRIAKNTAMLYFRMLFTMAVSLYTSRVVLNTLGVEDFGIYNVVGGVVTMFAFLNSAMASGTQRFLSFELGKKDYEQLNRVFSMSINIHATIAIVIFILAETIGLWLLNTQLTIPEERMIAANWVYQFSVFALIITIMSVPYNAAIIAHERMKAFAYVSIIEVSLKLIIVFILDIFDYDKLKLYAILIFGISFVIRLVYGIYCKKNFKECSYIYFWDKSLYKTLLSFAGWNLWGNIASVTMNQGINILLNIFFGPTINAARGIAFQVNSAVNNFVNNFMMAINPQIVKSYASNEYLYMHQLIYKGAKYSYFLIFTLSVPLLIKTETIIAWWLNIVPDYTIIFIRLILINTLIDSISGPLITGAQASGKIKLYQSVIGSFLLLILPISYLLLKFKFPAQSVIYVSIAVSLIILYIRLFILRKLIGIKLYFFFNRVLIPIIAVSISSLIISISINNYLKSNFINTIVVISLSILASILSIYFLGLNNSEKIIIKKTISKLNKINKKK